MTAKKALLDADGIVLTAAHAAQQVIEWEDGVFTTQASLDEAAYHFHGQLTLILEELDCTDFVLCFSDPSKDYFRKEVYPEYKANRGAGSYAPPMALKALRELVEREYPSDWRPGLEADDVMGILATDPSKSQETIIVSVDKDMKQIPGLLADPSKLELGIMEVEPEEAERFLWEQVLTGDSVDGYPGLKGVGPVAAERILDGAETTFEEAAWEAYKKKGYTLEFFEQMVNVARILQFEDYDDNGVKLWRRHE